MSAIAPPRPTTHRKRSHNSSPQSQNTWLGSYTDENDHRREVISTPAAAGSTLVIDRDASTHQDERLVAHLPADEPAVNQYVMCELYFNDRQGRHCRRATRRDRETPQPTVEATPTPDAQDDTQPLLALIANTLRISRPQPA